MTKGVLYLNTAFFATDGNFFPCMPLPYEVITITDSTGPCAQEGHASYVAGSVMVILPGREADVKRITVNPTPNKILEPDSTDQHVAYKIHL